MILLKMGYVNLAKKCTKTKSKRDSRRRERKSIENYGVIAYL
jgi:hypothetical protein